MRELLLPLTSLRGVGAAIASNLTKLAGQNKIFSLLLHKPIRLEQIAFCPRLFEAQNDQLVVVKAKIESHLKPATNRQPYKVICYNPTGYLTLVFFKIFPSQISKIKVGSEVAILGNLNRISGENQIVHPQEILPASEIEKMPKYHVIYPLIAGVTQKFLSKKINEVLAKVADDELGNALKILHYFKKGDAEQARKYLAALELKAWQIAVLTAKNNQPKTDKKIIKPTKNLVNDFLDKLPFEPTKSQLEAINEIQSEIFSNKKMLRLLQGDVGSGKTVVAISACLAAISKKQQSCVVAPTTVLAKQHFAYFQNFLEPLKIRVELLTSATTKRQREKILIDLRTEKIDILIATHAILEDDLTFANLGLAVIDEQHRFGVMQRLKLVGKGAEVDLLLMSATPIPRSLMMALYGDMDISTLSEKPKNRQKIETSIMSNKKSVDLYEAMKRTIARQEKIYWICPAIEENEELNLASVKKKFDELVQVFGAQKVGLLHGQMKEKDKEKVMSDFAFGESKILVSTTVIEVGIDVPDATVIIIENAENFGLSQLHQLRGRVGRSDKKSFCLLLYGEKYGANAKKRLAVMRESDDGFFLAEEDLKMRGSGDLLGTKQSGFPEFRIADLNFDSDLLLKARNEAETLINLGSQNYQGLLQLFDYDDCLKMVASG